MSRVHYRNETIRKAISELGELEQSMGWNLRCADPSDPAHQEAITALVQILEHFPKVRRLLDEVEAEVMGVYIEGARKQNGSTLIDAGLPDGQLAIATPETLEYVAQAKRRMNEDDLPF
jgi:hypothetical protein